MDHVSTSKIAEMLTCCTRWLVGKTDSPEDIRIKHTIGPVVVGAAIISIVNAIRTNIVRDNGYATGALPCFLTCVFFVGAAKLGKNMGRIMDYVLPGFLISIMLTDLIQASEMRERSWPFIILILDAGLVYRRHHCTLVVLGLTFLYLTTDIVERGFRFGLYSLPGAEGVPDACQCAAPPCAEGPATSVYYWLWIFVALFGDFSVTRGFSVNLQREMRRVHSAVEVASQIALALALYDVDKAEMAIADGKDLPEELAESFSRLVSNLKTYRPYLPHSCLVGTDLSSDGDAPDDKSSLPGEAVGTGGISPSTQCTVGEALFGPAAQQRRSQPTTPPTTTTVTTDHASSSGSSKDEVGYKAPKSPSQAQKNLMPAPRKVRVSLAAGNMLDYLNRPGGLAGIRNRNWIEADVERWCVAVISVKGVVDLVGGDRRYASFNARRKCGAHSSAAVEVLHTRGEGEWSGCVITGPAVCGNFGSSSARRFMVLGAVGSALHPFERIAAQWRTPVLADGEAFSGACSAWRALLLGAVFVQKRGAQALRVYSMTSRRSDDEGELYWIVDAPAAEDRDGNSQMAELIDTSLESLQTPSVQEEDGVVWIVKEVGLKKCG
eukprot:Hpha_TRINITY_DN16763_c2_g1::TRINITY_DN16763_c2_g1_i1::g.79567::m.79567